MSGGKLFRHLAVAFTVVMLGVAGCANSSRSCRTPAGASSTVIHSAARMPVLFVHGAADRFIPARFSQALYDAAHARKRLLLVDGATHNNSMRVAPDEYREALFALFGLSGRGEPMRAGNARGAS